MGIVKNTSQGMLTFCVIEFYAAIVYILSQNEMLNSSTSWPFSIDYDGKKNGGGNSIHLFRAENDKSQTGQALILKRYGIKVKKYPDS